MSRDPLKFLLKIAHEHPDIATFKLGPQRTFLLSSPEYIEDVLVANDWNFLKGRGLQRAKKVLGKGLLTSEGNFHRRQRRLSQPAFHKQRIAAYGAVMAAYAARTRDNWKEGETRDIAQDMMQLTLAIVAKTLFDADVQREAQEIGQALTEVLELFATFSSPLTEITDKLPTARNRRVKRGRQRLDETIYRIIAEHRAAGVDRGDLLSMLLLAQDTEEATGGMSDEQLRDEVMTLFLAGHETTANALAWTWYLLSQNPIVEAKMHAEIDEVLGTQLPTFEDVRRLNYTERVFTEAMRLYPPVWVMSRRAVSACKIGGYYVPAKSIVLLSQFVTHHDERYYDEPERFDPDRWLPEARAGRPKYAYFPFGGGPRLCIGEQFAWMEGILLLALIAQKWKLKLVPGHPVKPQPLITLRPKHGMKMTIEGR
ncbi:MAG: cytochrome P450 [Acidobacteria bacterium]|nr:MAG: cytochrome P450 [Acidobacteriota bacterium]